MRVLKKGAAAVVVAAALLLAGCGGGAGGGTGGEEANRALVLGGILGPATLSVGTIRNAASRDMAPIGTRVGRAWGGPPLMSASAEVSRVSL